MGAGNPADGEAHRFSSTVIVTRDATEAEYEEKVRKMAAQGAVIDHCPGCGAALDVSECFPLSQTTCPACGKAIKVLEHFGKFLLLSVIGQGGMGWVCRAFDRELERDVALKLLRSGYTNNPEYLEQLQQEAKYTASITHPHVVKVFSTGSENGYYYVSMEVIGGGTLAGMIRRRRLPEAVALEVGIQVAEGLHAAYLARLLHRDVKPGNILFLDQSTAKIADFGLAMTVEQAARVEGDVWGTPYYIAPEKILMKGEDVRSDIYSLGATLFHALAGRPVFEDASAAGVAQKQIETPPLSVQTFAPEVSRTTAFVIAQMLEKQPDRRQQNYDEVLAQLRFAQSELSSGAGRKNARTEIARQADVEQRVTAWITAAALAVVVFGGGAAIFSRRHASREVPKPSAPAVQAAALPSAAPDGSANASPSVAAPLPDAPKTPVAPSALDNALPVTAATTNSKHAFAIAANLADGNFATSAALDTLDVFFEFDLGKPCAANGVSVAFWRGDARKYTIAVLTSTDGVRYTHALTATSAGTTEAMEHFRFTPRTARYVRLVNKGNTENHYFKAYEACVTGTP